jgi:gliding motility-associated-like protein
MIPCISLLSKRCLLATVLLLLSLTGMAQIAVTNTNVANQLAQKLVGPGVILSNAAVQCNGNQSGIFVASNANLGIDSGIVLTTGLAATNPPNYGVNGAQINFANANQGTGGDADLTVLAGVNTYDRCILEFDFTANGDSIFFQYVFGSEEYPQFNCSNYNDVFGFFISGPGYAIPKNIALVPGTNIPVAINSVNSGVIYPGGALPNCTNMGPGSPFVNLYTNNAGGTSVTYEGFTHLFTAQAAIQPCSTYHLKLAIADGFDHILDSGVFLKAGSLKSNNVKLSVKTDSLQGGVPYVFEGCDTAILKIHRQIFQAVVNIDTVQLLISGTATNGTDYPIIATNHIFSNNINDTLKIINILPINDLITEGTETIKIKLKDKCNNIIDSVTIYVKDPPKFTLANNDTTICQGYGVVINGTYDPGLVFNWSPAAGVANPAVFNTTLSPAVTTTYTVTATYSNCASITDVITITVQPTPTLTLTPTNVLCNGQNTGSILATGIVGNNPLTFTLNPGGINANGSPHLFSNLAAGVYTVTITSGLGCTKTATATITQPTPLVWNNATAINIACNAGNIGQILTNASGGVGAITYTLNPGGITNAVGNFTGLAAGTYTVTAKDANNCSITTSLSIIQALGLTWATVNKTNITCNGLANGTITALAGGGFGTVTYNLNPGNVTNITGNFLNLGVNVYTILATDANGCTATTTVSITQAPALVITNVTITNVLCNGAATGGVTITTTGGTPIVNYTLNPGAITNATGIFTNKASGNYTITAVDANGCSVTTAISITQPPLLGFGNGIVVNPTCVPGNNGSFTLVGIGGVTPYQFKIGAGAYQASGTFTGLTAGLYLVTIKDANGCTKVGNVLLVNNNAPVLVNNTTPPACANQLGIINVTASGGVPPYTFTLLPNNITNNTGQFPGIAGGTYTVTVVDASGCTSSIVINLILPPILNWSNFTITNLPCTGIGTGSINATATGGTGTISYTLNPGAVTNLTGAFPGLAVNTYTVVATDANGCTVSSIAVIGIAPSLTFNAPIITNVLCNGGNTGAISVSTSGGTGVPNYTINPGGINNLTGVFPNLTAGTYTITGVDAAGCSATTVITVTQPNPLIISNITSVPPSCVPGSDGSITVTAIGGIAPYGYSINGGIFQGLNTFANLNIGTYTIQVKDANNCTKTSVFNLINPNAPSFSNVAVNQANCAGANTGSIIATVTGGVGLITFVINPLGLTNNTGIFNNLPVNNYTITATDANNCVITTLASIVQPSLIVWNATNFTNITCNGLTNGAINVNASGGNGQLTYTLQPGNLSNITGIFNPLVANNYTVTVTDANGCTLTTTFNITNPPAINWNNTAFTNVTCFNANNGTINAPAVGGTGVLNYNLMPGNITNITGNFANLPTATYTVTATDANGCTLTSSFTITSPPAFAITNLVGTTPNCVPGNNATITVTAAGGVPTYLYSINGNPPQASNVFTNIGVSIYTIIATDANGCTSSSTIQITNPASPSITNISTTGILCYGNNTASINVTASGGVGLLTYLLNPGAIANGNGVFNNLFANNYTVSVTDANGCSATQNILISQPPPLIWDSVDNRDIPCYGGNNGLVTSSASGGTGTIYYTLLPPNITNLNGAFFGLGVGQYTLLAVDSNGCTISAVFLINQAPQIVWSVVNVSPVSCFGGNNGIITVQTTGGVGGFDYKLQPGNVINQTGIFQNLVSGTYTITSTDLNNCTVTTVVFLNQASLVQLSNATTTPASCNPGCDGTVALTATGGNGVYTYALNAGPYQASNTFAGLCTGVYTVNILDGNGCTGTGTFSISTANGPSQINTNITNVICNGGNTGQIITTITGGNGLITYTLNPGAVVNNNGIFQNLLQGTYTIIVSDANGCTISTVVNVSQPPLLAITNVTTTDVTCFNGNNGTAVVSANGGNGALSYNLQPLNITNLTGIFTGLSAITYTVTVTDANGCTKTSLFTVGTPTPVLFTNIIMTPVSCNGGNNATIQATASGGIGNMNYNIQPNNINNVTGIFTGLSAITYTITATDLNNCSVTTTVTVTQPTPLQISQIITTIPTCVPGGDASCTITANGATPGYTYNINGGAYQASNIFNNLSVGTYTIIVKDANNCTLSSIVNIVTPNPPVITSVTMVNATCNPGCDGTLTLTSANGTGAHTYSINGGAYQVPNVFAALCAGSYTLTVKDASGCTASSVAVVTTYVGPVLVNTAVTNVFCNNGNNGTITLSVTGGNGPINYVLLPNNINNNTGAFTGLAAGIYTITGTDIYGCTLSTVVTITQPATLVFGNVVATSSLCFNAANGIIACPTIGGTQPISYVISPAGNFVPPSAFNGLLGNVTYTITATDANGCSTSTTAFVPEPSPVVINSITNTPVTCNGQSNGTLNATASGGTGLISYTLLPNNITNITGAFVNLAGNTYTIVVTDANGCTATSTSFLFEPTAITITNATATDIICFGQINGTVSVNAVGGTNPLSYNLQPLNITNGNGNFTGLPQNVYTVTITDANGCTLTNTQTVNEPSIVQFNGTTLTHVLCFGQNNGGINTNASGGVGLISYTLNPGAVNNINGIFNNLFAGLYTITATDANGCTATTTITIIQPQVLDLTLVSTTNITCHGGNDGIIVTTATGGSPMYLFTLMPGGINSSIGTYGSLFAGTYTLIVTDMHGCKDSVENITLTEPPAIVFTAVSHTDITCYFDTTGSISTIAQGGTGNISYSIAPNIGNQLTPGIFTLLQGGTYTVTATDASGCTATTTVTVLQNLQILSSDIKYTEPTCNGDLNGAIEVTAIGGVPPLTYAINGGNYSLSGYFANLGAGTHIIYIKDSKECIADTLVILIEPDKVGANVTIEPTKCNDLTDGKIFASGTGGRADYTYKLRPGLYINKTGEFHDIKIGTYTLSVIDSSGCIFDTIIAVGYPTNPMSIVFNKKDIGCYGYGDEGSATANIVGGEPPYIYMWTTNPIQTGATATKLRTGYYGLVVTDANGCTATDSVFIDPGPCCDEVFVPNAFSPNGDGKNDIWRIVTAAGFDLIQLDVYDRWGNKVWGTIDPLRGWDGTFGGKAMDMETYFYIFRYHCHADGNDYMKKGDVILVR